MTADYSEYYSNVYVYGTPPAQMPAHLWGPSIQWPSPVLVTIHPNASPDATRPTPDQGIGLVTAPPTPRAGSYSGSRNNALQAGAIWQPSGINYLGLRAPRAAELLGGIAHNPAAPLGFS